MLQADPATDRGNQKAPTRWYGRLFHLCQKSDQAGRSSESSHIGLWGDVDEPCEPRAGSLKLGQVTLCRGDDTQPGSVSLAGDLYRRDTAVWKVSLKVMFSLLTAASLVDDARVPDDAFKAVAHPPLVIPQVLITNQIDHVASVLRNADRLNLLLSSPNSMA